MNKKILIAAAFIAATGIMATAQAQENAKVLKIKTKSNIKNDKVSVVVVKSTVDGCSIAVCDKEATAKDAGSGMATGKRMHKPFVITKEFGVSSKDNAVTDITTAGAKLGAGGGSGKVSMSDISFVIQSNGKKIPLQEDNGEYTIPADCPDGDCTMVASWSWGEHNGGSSKRCDKTFTITMENGACKGITEKGIK